MKRILIVYGSTDGQTRKIAQVLAEDFRARLCSVDVLDAGGRLLPRGPETYDGVIVAASVHIGAFQTSVARWVRAHAKALSRRPTAFLAVCLAILEKRPEPREDIEEIMQRFFTRSGWQPSMTKVVAGAIRYTQYPWLKKWMMKRIVAKAGGGTDTTHDYEYTDWNDLRAFAAEFVTQLWTSEVMAGGVT